MAGCRTALRLRIKLVRRTNPYAISHTESSTSLARVGGRLQEMLRLWREGASGRLHELQVARRVLVPSQGRLMAARRPRRRPHPDLAATLPQGAPWNPSASGSTSSSATAGGGASTAASWR